MADKTGCVLVVDGSVQSTDLISHWLRGEALRIYTAESGLNALAKIEMYNPDVIITNVELPDMSGFDLCKTIKQGEQGQYRMVLCVSNLESERNRLRATEMGADDYVETGAELYQFVSKVRSLMRVKQLSNQLRQKYAELEEKNTQINRQLELGVQVQRALIPDINMRFKDSELLSRYYPSMGIGGDFYNVLQLTDHSIGIVMGDVSGHGIAAAFVTSLLSMMIKNLTPRYYNPDQMLFYLNNEMCALFEKSESTLYACVFYAVVNTRERNVRYANAGQCFPFFVDVQKNTVTELDAVGHPVGLMRDARYGMNSIAYNNADLLLFHTDGLQDVYHKDQPDEFTARMKDLLSQIRYYDSMRDMLNTICDNFYDEAAGETRRMEMDDASMILCRL